MGDVGLGWCKSLATMTLCPSKAPRPQGLAGKVGRAWSYTYLFVKSA